MSLFRRKREQLRTKPYDGAGHVVQVHQDDLARAMEGFVERLGEAYNTEPLSADQENSLSMAAPFMLERRGLPQATGDLAYSVARFGYFARAVEYEQYDNAREVLVPMYASAYSTQAEYREGETGDEEARAMELAFLTVATTLARAEPLKSKPEDWKEDRGPLTWGIPGLGGEVRAQLADHAIVSVLQTFGIRNIRELEDLSYEELRQAWNAGFFLRCIHELFDPELLGNAAVDAMEERLRET